MAFSLEDLELELIDFGVDELDADEEEIVIYGEFGVVQCHSEVSRRQRLRNHQR